MSKRGRNLERDVFWLSKKRIVDHPEAIYTDDSNTDIDSSFVFTKPAGQAVRAMNLMQSFGNGMVTPRVLDMAMGYHIKYMADEVQRAGGINYARCYDIAETGIWDGLLRDGDNAEVDFQRSNQLLESSHREFFNRIRRSKWTIFPANVGSHWVAIIIHLSPARNSEVGSYAVIKNVVVGDPARDPEITNRMWSRMRTVFSADRSFQWQCQTPQALWYPRQNDTFSCGLRTYDIMRVMFFRICEAYLRGSPDGYDDTIWSDFSRELHPGFKVVLVTAATDKIRVELIGITAVEALKQQKFTSRLFIGPFDQVATIGYSGRFDSIVNKDDPRVKLLHDAPQDLWPPQHPPRPVGGQQLETSSSSMPDVLTPLPQDPAQPTDGSIFGTRVLPGPGAPPPGPSVPPVINFGNATGTGNLGIFGVTPVDFAQPTGGRIFGDVNGLLSGIQAHEPGAPPLSPQAVRIPPSFDFGQMGTDHMDVDLPVRPGISQRQMERMRRARDRYGTLNVKTRSKYGDGPAA